MSEADEGMTLAEAEAVVAKVNEHVNGLGYVVEIRPQVLADGDKRDPADIVEVLASCDHKDYGGTIGFNTAESDVWLSMLTPGVLLNVAHNAMMEVHRLIVNHHLDKVEAECQA